MTRKTFRHLALAALAALAIAGCGGPGGGGGSTDQVAELLFSPTGGAVPSPNDLAFDGSQDGTVNASQPPIAQDSGPLDSIESINSQDGFSTIASSTASFTVPVDPSTVVPGTTVRVFEVTVDATTKVVTGIVGELTPGAPGDAGAEYTASLSGVDRNGRTLAVTPLAPLNESSAYLVAVTDGVQEQGGGAISASEEYKLVKGSDPLFDGSNSLVEGFSDVEAETLEAVRTTVFGGADVNMDGTPDGHVPVLEAGTSLTGDELIATWSFSTQSIGDVLTGAQGLIGAASITAAFGQTGVTTDPGGNADIWVGRLSGVPYYLGAPTGNDPDAPLTDFWEAATAGPAGERNLTAPNPIPRETTTVDIPVVLAIPASGCPAMGGCPIVIFQHGITTNRKSALGIADTLAQAGFATIGIDLPLHGITDTSDSLYAGDENTALAPVYGGDIERTFDLDLVDNDTGTAGSDGNIDSSGEHFINLASLRTSRDNLRQAVVDLLALESALGDIETFVNGAAGADLLDSSTVHFVGQSLGGIVGIPFLAQSGGITNAVVSAPGGGIAKLLDGSPSIGPEIAAGLAENGLTKGLSGYEQFLGSAQTLVDSADPINHAVTGFGTAGAGAIGATNLLVFEIIGGNSSNPDQVVPNFVDPSYPGTSSDTVPSPTGGTDPMVGLMMAAGLVQVGPGNSGTPGDAVVKFTAGEHSSLINPDTDPAVIAEMQSIAATFLVSGATVITNGSVVEDP